MAASSPRYWSRKPRTSGATLLQQQVKLDGLGIDDAKAAELAADAATAAATQEPSASVLLDLAFNRMSSVGAAALVEAVMRVRSSSAELLELNLSACRLHEGHDTPSAGLASVLGAPTLVGMQRLGLRRLILDSCGLEGAADAAAAARSVTAVSGNSLTSLDMSRNNLGPDGAVALVETLAGRRSGPGAPVLAELRLNSTGLSGWSAARAVEAARASPGGLGLPRLRFLSLSRSSLPSGACAGLVRALTGPGSPPVSALELESCAIDDEGAAAIADALASRGSLQHLQRLNLACNPFGGRGVAALATAVGLPAAARLTRLVIRVRPSHGEVAIAAVRLVHEARPGIVGPQPMIRLAGPSAAARGRHLLAFAMWAIAGRPSAPDG